MALTKIDDRGLKTPIDLLDNEKIRFGTGNDLELYHDGSNSKITNATGNFIIEASASGVIALKPHTNESGIITRANGASELYYDNSKKLETGANGVTVTGNIYTDGNVNLTADNKKIRLGAGEDLQIYHDGSNSKIDSSTGFLGINSNGGSLYLDGAGGGVYLRAGASGSEENALRAIPNGAVELYYDNSKKLETAADRVYIHGHCFVEGGNRIYIENGFTDSYASINNTGGSNDSSLNFYVRNAGTESTALKIQKTGNIELPVDNQKLQVGASQDLQIYHTGSHSIIRNTTGNLILQDDSNVVIEKTDGENMIVTTGDGAVDLYYDGSKKFETTSSGVKINGEWSEINGGTARSRLQIYGAGSSYTAADIFLQSNVTDSYRGLGTYYYDPAADVEWYTGRPYANTDQWVVCRKASQTTGGGNTAHGDNIQIRVTSAGNLQLTNNLIVVDNKKATFGNNEDLQIYHNETDSRIINSTGDLKIRSQSLKLETTDAQEYIRCTADQDVKLFYDNVVKLETTSSGIQVYSDGSAADGAKLTLKHLNNNSTDVISSILFNNNAGEAARIQGETSGANNTGVVKVYTDNAGTTGERLSVTSAGITVTGSVTTQDINLSNLNAPTPNEVDSTRGSWTMQEGADDLFLINRSNGKKYKFNLTEVS